MARGVSDVAIETRYFSNIQECIGSLESPKGNLAVWSPRSLGTRLVPAATWFLFDKNGNPIEYVWRLFQTPPNRKDWHPDQVDLTKGELYVRNTVDYEQFFFSVLAKDGTKQKKSLYLPVMVHSTFVSKPFGNREMISVIGWKFSEDVPDTIFDRPQGLDFPVLRFEDIDMDLGF